MTELYSLFSKMKITIWEKSGTSGRGVEVAAGVGDKVRVDVGAGEGVEVGGIGVGEGSLKAGKQAEVKKETRVVIQRRR